MRRSDPDRAADLFQRLGQPVLPLSVLASGLGTDPASLERDLRPDPRFRLFEKPAALQPAIPCPPALAAAYADALARAGLAGGHLVLLLDAAPVDRGASTADLLRRTLAILVRTGSDDAALEAADAALEVTAAIRAITPAAAGPSTIPPPPAPPTAPARPRWRPPSPSPPRDPGSRPG